MTGIRISIVAIAAGLLFVSHVAHGQLPAAGDLDPSGRVLAKISVTMSEPNAYGHPISQLRFLVATESGDRISIRTDDAGIASAWVRPGSYRFVTPDALEWRNNAYTWDVVVPIRAGTGVIRLSQSNANKITPIGNAPNANAPTASTAPSPSVPVMEPYKPDASPASREIATTRHDQLREGIWFNVGFGYGVFGCKVCDGTLNGLTGGLVLGGTLNQRFLLGVGTTGWTKSQDGVTLSVGTLDARFRFYPSATGGFFLTGGVGVGSISGDVSGFGSETETGVGVVLGLGMDFRIAKNVSLTPFWNGFAVQASNDDANVGQLGLGITFH